MKSNVKQKKSPVFTHEGAPAYHTSKLNQLRRSVLSCLLWEKEFYECGVDIAQRVSDLVAEVSPDKVAELAIEAREKQHLRHMPLFLVRQMARLDTHKHLVADTLERVIQRVDELAEFLAIYFKDNKTQPLSAQVKRGLARAFGKFNEYQFAKYDRDGEFKLRDVMFLVHPKPSETSGTYKSKRPQLTSNERLFKDIAERTLTTPDTWEVELSAGADKRATFERLIAENKLGALAFLRNLRNMSQAGVSKSLIAEYVAGSNFKRVLPFRFIAASRFVPQWEDLIETAMLKCVSQFEKLPGRTVLLVDVSGSMDSALSTKSDMLRLDAAYGLAILIRELAQDATIYSFSNNVVDIPNRRGFALRDAIAKSQPHSGTYLGQALQTVDKTLNKYDRIIVITDEQSHDRVPAPKGKGYVINVASYKNGIGYGPWTHIDGFSENVIEYIQQAERFIDL